ncbi:apolipoprotein A-II [Dunckerocampus dactyliophorus]|uniref:apolipoprotein A-II n=1 Tax=Dunckerocampus dactyliophorus TaxID=161453 RepID=UPI0024055B3E|nr:apolipoprotein A-II [Dunckerocampus dactyliophorus]
MHAKYAVALILALQVSMSLCDVPQPDQDLVEKYEAYRTTFYKRLLNAYGKLQAAVAPVIEKIGEDQHLMEGMQSSPQVQALAKVARGMAEEISPLVEKARMATLGVYGHYLRPHIGQYLSDSIDQIKVYLDKFLPAQ